MNTWSIETTADVRNWSMLHGYPEARRIQSYGMTRRKTQNAHHRLIVRPAGVYRAGRYMAVQGPPQREAMIEFVYQARRDRWLAAGKEWSAAAEFACRELAEAKADEWLEKAKSKGIPEVIKELFAARTKQEAERICKSVSLSGADLVSLTLNAKEWGYWYKPMFREFVPKDLPPLGFVEKLPNGEFEFARQHMIDPDKSHGQMNRAFAERRINTIHWFNKKETWHCMYFSQTDILGEHWVGGQHLHYISHLWGVARRSARDALKERNINLPSAHIKYSDTRMTKRYLLHVDDSIAPID